MFLSNAFYCAWCFKTLQSSALKALVEKGNLRFISWLAHIIPALILVEGVRYLTQMPESLATIISNLSPSCGSNHGGTFCQSILNLISLLHESRDDAKEKPIKATFKLPK